MIRDTKTEYHSKLAAKLVNPSTSAKTYCSILKTFANGRTITVIPPLLINDKFISNFRTKANYFNRFFNQQCTAISADSSIPSSVNFVTNETVTAINLDKQLISKLLVALNPNKADGHDELSIFMLQMGSDSISKPLSIIFRICLKTVYFPTAWKKANVVPVRKKGNKQVLNEYRPVSLLPICSKVIFDTIFQHLIANKLLNPNQSGVMSGDSCIHQLTSITHEIYAYFDANPSLEARGVFLDISKVFDRAWHERFIYKLKCIGLKGDLLALIESFLFERQHRVVLNGQESEWLTVNGWFTSGFNLGALLFL